ncbi:PspC domain-containing protein [Candidatus Chloroploca sp. Khr17]|uniref:PspC domain-containing protein n=1 Tax=Candidatus Chloroploca sp. Khr17 TaxID=2496869 RepID=UPI00196B663D|nr:PspC domain-containing protein [Candidatus Chloroploca sp. Khr17]
MENRLVRSSSNRMLGGVCGGLARYFNIDATIVRLVFVLAVLSGLSPLLYLILWIVMPEEARVQNTLQPPVDPTGEWQYDPYTGQPVKKQ